MLLLQQGWGMLAQIKEFLRAHPDSGVIMSPRICDKDQMERHIPEIKDLVGQSVFFDPHFYEPRTNLERILTYPYFENFQFDTDSFDHCEFCARVVSYQKDILGLSQILLPGRYTNSVTEAWLRMHYECAERGVEVSQDEIVYSTIAVGPDVILNSDTMNSLVDEVVTYPTGGVYFVFEHPRNSYFLDEEFLYILMDAFLSIVLGGKRLIVGYANQQSLVFLATGADAIATGNYRNVRAFDHLNSAVRDTENWRKATWYFDGSSFGEYRIPALSLAFRRNLNDMFGPTTQYAEPLLSSTQPTSIRWSESDAFAHYLTLLHYYTTNICAISKKERASMLLNFFNEKLRASEDLGQAGFHLGDRGFQEAANSTLAALESFVADRSADIAALV
jgi:hypothetical protein